MIEFALESGRGEIISLLSRAAGDGEFILGEETTGFGIADVETRFASGAGVGSRLLSARVGEQDASLHLVVGHPDRHERERLLRKLAHIVRYRPGQPLPRVTAAYPDGMVLERPFVYRGGASSIVDGASDSSEVLLDVTHPHPYWRSRRPFEWRTEIAEGEPLLPEFIYQQVVGSTASSEQLVTNPGAVPVPIKWYLTGPADPGATVLVGDRGFTFGEALSSGEVITIDVTAQGVTVTDQTGADRFADLDGTPEFPWMPEGTERVVMLMTGMTAGESSMQGMIFPEFEVVHG